MTKLPLVGPATQAHFEAVKLKTTFLTLGFLLAGCALEEGGDDGGAGGMGALGGSGAAAGSGGRGGSAGSGGSSASGGTGGTGASGGTGGTAGGAGGASGSGGANRGGAAGTGTAGTGTAGAGTGGASGAAGAGAQGGLAGSATAGTGGLGGAAAGQGGASAGGAGKGGASGSGGSGGNGEFNPCPTNGDVCRILPLGDSITDGVGVSGGGGYRIELFSKALEAGQNITFTGNAQNGPQMVDNQPFPRAHEGHSGWKIAQLNPLIPDPAFTNGCSDEPNCVPHIVLLHIGTNDIFQNDNLAQAPMRLGTLLDLLIEEAPDALIVVGKIIPGSSNSGPIKTYNDAIPALVEARAAQGKHIVLVDHNTGFPTSELADGVHPNAQGYARMAGVWYEAIKDFLPQE